MICSSQMYYSAMEFRQLKCWQHYICMHVYIPYWSNFCNLGMHGFCLAYLCDISHMDGKWPGRGSRRETSKHHGDVKSCNLFRLLGMPSRWNLIFSVSWNCLLDPAILPFLWILSPADSHYHKISMDPWSWSPTTYRNCNSNPKYSHVVQLFKDLFISL